MVGYDAGYYSYLWALVYACDAFSEFEKKGVLNQEVGMRWKKEVLEKGSSEDEIKKLKDDLATKKKYNEKYKDMLLKLNVNEELLKTPDE